MAQLKSTNITGNLAVSGNILGSKIIKLGGTDTQILLANGDVLDVPAAGLGTVTKVELKPLDGIIIEGDPITDSGFISIGHENTSDVTELKGTDRTYVKSLQFDQFGHVTGYETGTETVTDTDTTYEADRGISLVSGKFGHSNTAITKQTTKGLYKISYDAYGHITGTESFTLPTKDSWNYDDMYVKYSTAQTLTDDQKTQARTNIGAGTSSFSGKYDDLTNKPDIPDPTDYYWANVKVGVSSSTSTKPTFANNFLVNIATNNVLTPGADWAIASAIPKYLWHDLLPFRAAKAEYSTDGTTWTEDTTDTYRRTLTNQKENQTITVLSDSRPYARFTWDGGSAIWHACQADWLVIGFAYASPAAQCSIKFQYSTDGTTWVDSLTVASGSYNSAPSWFKINSSFSQCRAVRLVLTRTNSSGTLNLSSVKWLTKRWGNQGMGSELEKPYSWDNNANLYYRNTSSTLGLSSAPWSAIYGTTIYENGTSLINKYALKTEIQTNTDTQVRQYQFGENEEGDTNQYPLLARYNLTNKNGTYDTAYSRFHTEAYLDISDGSLTAKGFKYNDTTKGTNDYVLLAGGDAKSLSDFDITITDTTEAATKKIVSDIEADGHTITISRIGIDDLGLASAYKYKGTKANLATIQAVTTKEIGDVYNAEDTGMNYAWNGEIWDALGSIVTVGDGTLTIEATGTGISASGTFTANQETNSQLSITLNSNSEGNRDIGQVVIAKDTGIIATDKLAISYNTSTKATWQYNASTDCIELIW